MKRILSLFIAVVMIASMCVFATPGVSATTGVATATLDEHNVGIEVPHFSGWTSWNPPAGYAIHPKKTPQPAFGSTDTWLKVADLDVDDEANWDLIDELTADYDGALIRLDGVITEEEWGLPLVTVDSDYAAQKGSSLPSAENTYYYYLDDKDGSLGLKREEGLSFKLWMAWDELHLYIAAVVDDPDGPYCNLSGENVWNSDCFQVRIDPDGPNSVVNGHGYDASEIAFPWASVEHVLNESATLANPGAEINGGKVINLGAAYYSPGTASGRTELFDMSPRYYPSRVAVELANGEVDYYKTEYKQWGAGYKSVAEDAPNPFGTVYGAILPSRAPTEENEDRYETTYEIAIPWTYINGSKFEYSYDEETGVETCELNISEWIPGVGDEFGISVALLNAAMGSGGYNSWLTWGSGICGAQMGTDDGTAGGSNSMILSSAELGTVGCDHEFADPTCIAPYVCTKCGYEKGFCTGHDYTNKVISTPTSTKDGKIVSTCNTCGYVHEAIIEAQDGALLKSWSGKLNDPEWHYYECYYEDEDGNALWNEDGTRKTNYIQYEGDTVLAFIDDDPGTYFMSSSNYSTFSYKYDLKLTDLGYNNVEHDDKYHYVDGVYHWFGGIMNNGQNLVYGLNYAAGFFPSEKGSTSGKFMIREAEGGVLTDADQKILCESAEIDLGKTWHEIVFMFDDDSDTAFIFCDGEYMCGTWNEGFDMNGATDKACSIMRRFDTSYVMKGMQMGNKTAFIENVVVPSDGYTLTCGGEVIGTYDAGEVVELPVPSLYTDATGAAYRFYTWECDDASVTVDRSNYSADTATANGRTYSVVMPSADVELTAKYVLVGDLDGNGQVNGLDVKLIKSVLIGTATLSSSEASESADVKLDGQVNGVDVKELKALTLGSSKIER